MVTPPFARLRPAASNCPAQVARTSATQRPPAGHRGRRQDTSDVGAIGPPVTALACRHPWRQQPPRRATLARELSAITVRKLRAAPIPRCHGACWRPSWPPAIAAPTLPPREIRAQRLRPATERGARELRSTGRPGRRRDHGELAAGVIHRSRGQTCWRPARCPCDI